MSGDLNRITLIGHVEFVIENNDILSFRMSTKEVLKDINTGERTELLEHHMIVCSKDIVSMLRGNIFKGVRVFVDGAIRGKYSEDNNANSFEIYANVVEVLRDEKDCD